MRRSNWMISAVLAVVLATDGLALAQQSTFAPTLHIKRDEDRPRSGFQFRVVLPQRPYRPSEPITFEVSGSRPFYLWAYTVARDGQATVLVPLLNESVAVYAPDRRHRVPGLGHHFYTDGSGPHHLTLIASTRPFDIDHWLRRQGHKSNDRLTLPTAELEAAFAELGVHIGRDRPDGGNPSNSADAEVVVRYLDFEVAR